MNVARQVLSLTRPDEIVIFAKELPAEPMLGPTRPRGGSARRSGSQLARPAFRTLIRRIAAAPC